MASAYDSAFDALLSAGPIVDNASPRLYSLGELEGDRCACGAAIPGDVERCGDCASLPCGRCDGDGCDWHLSPTNGAVEIDRACTTCKGTGRTTR